jgi:hypothetical protein
MRRCSNLPSNISLVASAFMYCHQYLLSLDGGIYMYNVHDAEKLHCNMVTCILKHNYLYTENIKSDKNTAEGFQTIMMIIIAPMKTN